MNKYIFGLIISAVFIFTALFGGAKTAYAGCYVVWSNLNPANPAENQDVSVEADIITSSAIWNGIHITDNNNPISFNFVSSTAKGGCWGMNPTTSPWGFKTVNGQVLCNVPKYEAKVNSGAKNSAHSLKLFIGGMECWPSETFFSGVNDPNPSCNLDHKFPLTYSPACYGCLANNTQLKGGIDYILSQQPQEANCTRQEAAAHECNGGVSPENQAGCLKEATTTCATSCGAPAFLSPTPPPPTTVTISGRVTDAKTGVGIPNVTLNQTACLQPPMTTNSSGFYQATNVPVGSWLCLRPPATAPGGYANPSTANPLYPKAATYECQQVGGLYDTSACSPAKVDLTSDTAFNFTYTSTVVSPTIPPNSHTIEYRYTVDAPFNAGDTSPEWLSYSAADNDGVLTKFDYPLADPTADKIYTVYVQFKSDKGDLSNVSPRQIKYVVPPPPTEPPTPTPTTAPTYTIEYRCSDVKFEKDDSSSTSPQWLPYNNADFSGEPVDINYTFTHNVVPGGNLTLFCQFRDNKSLKSPVFPKSIKYVGGLPKITSVLCTYSPTGTGTQVTIKGRNFGEHSDQGTGNVKVEGKDAKISYWAQDVSGDIISTSSATPAPANSDTKYQVISSIPDKLTDGRHQVVLTTDDGTSIGGFCTLGLTTVDFTLKTACLAQSSDLAQDNVAVEIKEKVDNAKSLYKKKIKIDKEGKPVDFTPGLEIGKTYVLSIRAPKTVSRKVEFVADAGTTILDDIILPVGDIYPVASPDNKVNAFDKAEMSREWSIINDVTRLADLNNDSRVNSVDYSCLQSNYNKTGD